MTDGCARRRPMAQLAEVPAAQVVDISGRNGTGRCFVPRYRRQRLAVKSATRQLMETAGAWATRGPKCGQAFDQQWH
jgi:hypothetical protein